MNMSLLEKNLIDINNDPIPENVMTEFWKLKNEIGNSPMGISKINDIYFIVSPASKEYILWTSAIFS